MHKIIFAFSLLFLTQNLFSQFFQHTISNNEGPYNSCVSDIDGDGKKDILTAFFESIDLNVNLGNGQFSERQTIISTINPTEIVAVDMDNDGDNDIITVEKNILKLYENLGNLKFKSSITLLTVVDASNDISNIIAEDRDHDLDVDIVVSLSYGNLLEYINLGGNKFSAKNIINGGSYGNSGSSARSIKSIDVNGDGYQDVVINSYSYAIAVATFDPILLKLNDLIFYSPLNMNSFTNFFGSDLDGDGDIDIALTLKNGSISWTENLGSGVFGNPISILINNTNSSENDGIMSNDIDGDGDFDIISTSYNENTITLFKNLGSKTFSAPIIILDLPDTDEKVIYAFDVDNDNDNDVLFFSDLEGKVAWCENIDTNHFSGQKYIYSDISYPKSIATNDIDLDGKLDILFSDNNYIGWLKNEGNFFSKKMNRISEEGATKILSVDLDGDGKNDILSVSEIKKKITWYKNLGINQFSSQILISNQVNGIISISAEDIDNDGDRDLIVGSELDNKIVWFENLGGGSFSEQKIITTNMNHIVSLFIIDINNDGYKDILYASSYDNKMGWFINNRNKTFGPQRVIYSYTTYPSFITSTDLDGDHDNDVIAYSMVDRELFWFENLGNENFGPKKTIETSFSFPTSLFTSDLDMDGDQDIVYGSSSNHIIAWFENLGNKKFQTQKKLNSPEILVSLIGVDLDADLDTDIIFSENDKIFWSENNAINNKIAKGKLYFDINKNGIYDGNDQGLNQGKISSYPINDYSFSNQNGEFFITYHDTITCKIQPEIFKYWKLTSDSSNYHIKVDSNFFTRENLDFGFYPDTLFDSIKYDLVGAFPRCNTIVNYWINIQNIGTTLSNGLVHLQLDNANTFIHSSLSPDSINGNNIYWKYDSLMCFSDKKIQIEVKLPSFQKMGDFMNDYLTISTYNSTRSITKIYKDTLKQKLVCSYDPNDKNVCPSGIEDEGYILDNVKWLEYTIRFQNTGTDTAINVIVKDQLSNFFDWSTLTPLASSHSPQIDVDQKGLATFDFSSIFLPDSNTNELLSHGYIKYKIKLLDKVASGSTILNAADIYFDKNSAIHTNSTTNTMYECPNSFQIPNLLANYCKEENVSISYSDIYKPSIIEWKINDLITQSGNNLNWKADTTGTFTLKITLTNPLCSIDTSLQIKISQKYNLIDTITICKGDSALVFGNYKTTEGLYAGSILSKNGCDSIIGKRIQFFAPIPLKTDTIQICQGDSTIIFGEYRKLPNTYYDTLNSINGCDSIIGIKLNLFKTISPIIESQYICPGDSSIVFGTYRSLVGTYYDTLQSINGCDSVNGINLILYNLPNVDLSEFSFNSICKNSSPIALPNTIPLNGIYSGNGINNLLFDPSVTHTGQNKIVYTFRDNNGCVNSDSTFINVFEPKINISTKYICFGESINIFGVNRNLEGIYTDSLTTINKCDSIVKVQLINYPKIEVKIIDTLTICSPNKHSIFGIDRNTTNNYYDTLQSINGCDSIIGIHLEVIPQINVKLEKFKNDTICSESNFLELPIGTPSGGIYIGNGIVNSEFNPSLSNLGKNYVYYSLTYNNCINKDSTSITILNCAGLNELTNNEFIIYPNPFENLSTIEVPDNWSHDLKVSIYSATGQLIFDKIIFNEKKININQTEIGKGIFMIHLTNNLTQEKAFLKLISN